MKRLVYTILITGLFFVLSCHKDEKDETPPVITLFGDTSMTWHRDTAWIDPGYKATDDKDGDITNKVKVSDKPNIFIDGEYLVRYNVLDEAGNFAEEKVRKVKVMIY